MCNVPLWKIPNFATEIIGFTKFVLDEFHQTVWKHKAVGSFSSLNSQSIIIVLSKHTQTLVGDTINFRFNFSNEYIIIGYHAKSN